MQQAERQSGPDQPLQGVQRTRRAHRDVRGAPVGDDLPHDCSDVIAALDEEVGADAVASRRSASSCSRERFLGSPTVRIDGKDVEPGADRRTGYGLKCRLFQTSKGLRRTPDDEWVLAALERARGILRS